MRAFSLYSTLAPFCVDFYEMSRMYEKAGRCNFLNEFEPFMSNKKGPCSSYENLAQLLTTGGKQRANLHGVNWPFSRRPKSKFTIIQTTAILKRRISQCGDFQTWERQYPKIGGKISRAKGQLSLYSWFCYMKF